MAWFSRADERRRKLITDAPSLEVAIKRAAGVVSLPVLGYQAEAIAEAVGIWASGVAAVRYVADRQKWETAGFRDYIRQEMRWKLLDKITREGHVPVSLPAEALHRTRLMPWTADPEADDVPVPRFSMPEDSDWDQVIIVLEAGIRSPPVDRQAAVKAGVLGGR
jgi:hypothetical protein